MGKKRLRRELRALERINASLTTSNASVREDLAELRRGVDEIWAAVRDGDEPMGTYHLPTVVARRMAELQEWRSGWRSPEPSVFGPMREPEERVCRGRGRLWTCMEWYLRCVDHTTPCATMTGCGRMDAWSTCRCLHPHFYDPGHTHSCGVMS